MSCPLNKKRWLIFNYEGEHEWEFFSHGYWGHSFYEYWKNCKHCGETIHEFGVTRSRMIRLGLIDKSGDDGPVAIAYKVRAEIEKDERLEKAYARAARRDAEQSNED